MLILSRKIGEKVLLKTPAGEEIEVVLVDIDRDKARLGFSAPLNVIILRDDIKNPSKYT